jgi:Cu/Ag efflux protein CusF
MRLWKVVILVNLALALGLVAGYLWWDREVARLRREVETVRQEARVPVAPRRWVVQGIVRAPLPDQGLVLITHEPIPGLMGAMTMPFRVSDGGLMRGIEPGDRVQFVLVATGDDLLVVALERDLKP